MRIHSSLHPVCVCAFTHRCILCVHTSTNEVRVYLYAHLHLVCMYRPIQSMIYVPLQVYRFQKIILLIVQYKLLKSCSQDLIPQNLILRTRLCATGFITQSSWGFHSFHPTMIVGSKCFLPQLYQFRRGISGGPALQYFYMIHRGGRDTRARSKVTNS